VLLFFVSQKKFIIDEGLGTIFDIIHRVCQKSETGSSILQSSNLALYNAATATAANSAAAPTTEASA
jgi:hypothetical protein